MKAAYGGLPITESPYFMEIAFPNEKDTTSKFYISNIFRRGK